MGNEQEIYLLGNNFYSSFHLRDLSAEAANTEDSSLGLQRLPGPAGNGSAAGEAEEPEEIEDEKIPF